MSNSCDSAEAVPEQKTICAEQNINTSNVEVWPSAQSSRPPEAVVVEQPVAEVMDRDVAPEIEGKSARYGTTSLAVGYQSSCDEVGDEPATAENTAEAKKSGGRFTGLSGLGSSFGSWGSSLISNAASSVSTAASSVKDSVGGGISNAYGAVKTATAGGSSSGDAAGREKVTDKVEHMPTLAEQSADDIEDGQAVAVDSAEGSNGQAEANDDAAGSAAGGGWLSSMQGFASNIGHSMQSGGKSIYSGGMNVVESIGKRTKGVLEKGDSGVESTRKLFGDQPSNLSNMLRQAKTDFENRVRNLTGGAAVDRTLNYGAMFDEYQGLVHLEALEMLSQQSRQKLAPQMEGLQNAVGNAQYISHIQGELDQIREEMEQLQRIDDTAHDEEHAADGGDCGSNVDFVDRLDAVVAEMGAAVSGADRLKEVHLRSRELVVEYQTAAAKVGQDGKTTLDYQALQRSAIDCLAQLTARCVECFHKSGEMMLAQSSKPAGQHVDFVRLTTLLVSLTKLLLVEVRCIGRLFIDKLNSAAIADRRSEEASTIVDGLHTVCSDSSTYIKEAASLLVPVVQLGNVHKALVGCGVSVE